MGALEWGDPVQFSFSGGIQTRGEKRVQNPPYCDVLRDGEFDDIGGLRTRKPYGALSNSILGGGTLSNCRRLFVDGNELCVMTDTGVYTWSAQESAWVLIDTYLAPKITEHDVFAATSDQYQGDRAELNGVVMYVWVEGTSATCFFAAFDKTTGAAIQVPFSLGTSPAFPRLTALATRVLFTFEAVGVIRGIAVDPANVASTINVASTSLFGTAPASYDIVKIPNADTAFAVAARATTLSYDVAKITSALAVTTANKVRVVDGPIACSIDPTSTNVQIVRANGTNIQGDLLLVSSLADVFTAQAVGTAAGTPVNHIATAHRLVQNGGQYRCYAFWAAQSSTTISSWFSKFNWVDTGNTLGTQANFIPSMDIASRAFAQGSNVFVTGMFNGASPSPGTGGFLAVESTCFLYRDDGRLVARLLRNRAGGFHANGWLPGVQLTSGSTVFSFAGSARRIVPLLLDGTGYAARIPVDVTIELDSNEARRTAKMGSTTYITGGLVSQYDGRRIVEVGFLPFPWNVAALHQANAGGAVADGTYAYKASFRSTNARGEIDRSTCATTTNVVETAGTSTCLEKATCTALNTTLKPDVSVELWRTQKNPNADSDFFRMTSADPSTAGATNGYLANDPTVSGNLGFVNDGYSDATLSSQEIHPESDGVLTYVAPPPGTLLLAGPNRLFIAGIPGDPDRVWYSRLREQGKVVAFNDALKMDVTPTGGSITALSMHREALIVFRQTAVYELPGSGFDNARGGQNYGPCQTVSDKIGAVSQEAVAFTPVGTVFKSSQGWQLLTDQKTIKYIGAPVAAFDSDTVLDITVVESQQQIRVLTNNRMLVWDFLVDQWAEWTITGGLDALMWQGTHVYLTTTGPLQQRTDYTGVTYGLDVETAWIKLADLQGYGRVRWFELLSEFRSACGVRLRTAYDYESDGAGGWIFRDDLAKAPTSDSSANAPVVGGTYQVRRGVSRGQCEAIKIRISAIADATAIGIAGFTTASGFTSGGAVVTSGTAWTATLASLVLGVEGNALTVSVYTSSGVDTEVRDHQSFNGSAWVTDPYNVGIKAGTSATVADLERYITNYSKLVSVFIPDPAPTKTITNSSSLHTGPLTGGTTTLPTGEALKLAGLALEIGRRKGLARRLSSAQKG